MKLMKPQTDPPSTLQGQYAGFISRLIAYTIDLLVVIATITIVGITVDMFLRFFGLDEFIDTLLTGQNVLGEILRFFAFVGSIAFISFSYFVLIWTFTAGQSVGKLLMGLRIVPLDGSKMGFGRSVIRYFAFLLSAVVLFIGLFWVLVSDSRQGWHDKIARTCVIYDWPAREDDGVVGRLQSRWSYVKHTRRRLKEQRAEKKARGGAPEIEAAPEETEAA